MRARRHLTLLLCVTLAACVPELPGGETRRDTSTDAPRDDRLLRDTMLDRHARERRRLRLPPLRWSAGLAAEALAYARSIAVTRDFRHSEQPAGHGRQGENLWAGARGAFTYDEMIDGWAAERRVFVEAPTPGFSRTGRWQDAAHYAQIVWRRTTLVGCALASNRTDDFLVCRYLPPGNVVGERAY